LQDHNALIEDLRRELSTSSKQCEALKENLKEKEDLYYVSHAKLHEGETKFLETIYSLEAKLASSNAKHELRQSEMMQKMEAILKEERAKHLQVSIENESLVAKLEAQSETANVLEEYKKRAQVALKKVIHRFAFIIYFTQNN
jgi:hypothetical protein